jgi:hypothetical protein
MDEERIRELLQMPGCCLAISKTGDVVSLWLEEERPAMSFTDPVLWCL